MRKFYALISLILFSGMLAAQVAGDYRWVATTASSWSTVASWEKHNGSTWVASTDYPGQSGNINSTVTLIDNGNNDARLNVNITVGSSGSISISSGGSPFTLWIGYLSSLFGSLTNYGEVVLVGGNSKLRVGNSTSQIIVPPGGKITDNSGGTGITCVYTSGIVLQSSSGLITGSLKTNSIVSGTFQQFISDDQWHFFSPVFDGVIAGDLWDGSTNAYLLPYNSPGAGWGEYISNVEQELFVGTGYRIWQTAPFTYEGSGTFVSGDKTLSVSQGGTENADWCFVGNPYPCGLDWGLVDQRTRCVGSAFYVYDGSSYLAHNGTTGAGAGDVGDATSGIIPAMQGFFVKSNGGGDITITNTDKAHADVDFYKSQKTMPEYISNFIRLQASYDDQKFTTVLYQQDEATNGDDIVYDAEILFNSDPNFMDFYSLAGEKTSCINIYNDYPYTTGLGLNIPSVGGMVTLNLTETENLDETFTVFLEDLETNRMIDLIEEGGYTYILDEGGAISNRFLIHLNSTVGVDNIDNALIDCYSYRNEIYVVDNNSEKKDIFIYDIIGNLVYNSTSDSGLFKYSMNSTTGYYIVKVVTGNSSISEKLFIQN